MHISSPKYKKKIIRTYIRSLRRSLQLSEQYIAAQLITNKIITLNCIRKSKHIAVFISFDGEIRTDLLIKTLLFMNKYIYVPIVPSCNCQYLSFTQYTLSTPLIKNPYIHTYEPEYNKNSIISIKKLDIMFIPLVAFDKYGNRLGMGGGFYDKTLLYYNNKTNCTFIGLGYDFQKIPKGALPSETKDVNLSKIITPNCCYWK